MHHGWLAKFRRSPDTELVNGLSYGTRSGAGRSANERYQQRYGAWRRRVWKYVLTGAVGVAAVELIAWALWPGHGSFYLGLALGMGMSFCVVVLGNPPEHIDRWRRGAEGERRTARALRRLPSHGWTIVHDIPQEYGNLDHVAVGPGGVFLLDSKALGGDVTVEDGVVRIRWLEDPDDGYECSGLSRRLRASAADLRRRLGGAVRWVEPVVVIWGRFEQEVVEADGVAFVHGNQVAYWLAFRQQRLNADAVRRAAQAVEELAKVSDRRDR